ncbi:MAG: efflux RND transporter periplasmic adaptor subunit [Chitinispirillaceae bacterium]|nr:efflux RND transporter periplasmic adaptor subunit [Chitinispirillaceae bacterium]
MYLTSNRTGIRPAAGFSMILLSVCLTALLCAGCSRGKSSSSAPAESISDIQKREGVPVRVVTVDRTDLKLYEYVGGTAEGFYQTTLTAGIPGTITSVNVAIGSNVKKGASLMKIEPAIPQNYDLVKQQFENAEKSRKRVSALAEEGAVSQEIIDQVDIGYSTAKEGLDIVRKNQFVVAPISGTVLDILLQTNNNVHPGAELVTIADVRKIRVPVTVSDLLINRFHKGQRAEAVIDGDTITGQVDRIPLSGNQSTHTFTIDVVFDNPDIRIKPGMYLKLRIVTGVKEGAITLPMDAVIIEGTDKSAYIVIGGIAKKIAVTAGDRSGDRLEITGGVDEGAQVVVSGAGLLSDGTKVKIVR